MPQRTTQGQRGGKRQALTFLVLAIAAMVGLRKIWLPVFGEALIIADPLLRADAIVPFAGDIERIEYSAELFGQGYAEWYVVTNMPVAAPYPPYIEQVRRQLTRLQIPAERIIEIPETVTSTYEEAVRLREFARERGWSSLLVVTSPYHTRRTRTILHDVFRDTDITVSVVPVVPGWYKPDAWWPSEHGRRVTLSEYAKLALYLGGYRR